jgi:hypothetical protein
VEIPENFCEEDCIQDEAHLRKQLPRDGKMKYFYIIGFNDEFAVDMYMGGTTSQYSGSS